MIYYYDSYPAKLRWNEKYNRNTSYDVIPWAITEMGLS